MRYSFVSKSAWEPGCGKLIDSETGDLMNVGAHMRLLDDYSALESRHRDLVAAAKNLKKAAEGYVDWEYIDVIDKILAQEYP